MTTNPEITADAANALGHYVYAYIDPRNGNVFYVGKGVGARAIQHLGDNRETAKVARIREIRDAGLEPRIDIIAHQLRDDQEACRVESALIEMLGVDNLTNVVRGESSTDYPRRPLKDLVAELAARPVELKVPALLVRINRLFDYGMSAEALYEATRGIWVVGKRRERARYAMAVYGGIVREVYEIDAWHPAGSTPYATRNRLEFAQARTKRWEFTGHLATDAVRTAYIGGSVAHLFRPGQQSPLVGVNLGVAGDD